MKRQKWRGSLAWKAGTLRCLLGILPYGKELAVLTIDCYKQEPPPASNSWRQLSPKMNPNFQKLLSKSHIPLDSIDKFSANQADYLRTSKKN